ncbi:hypothetical protein HanIR_Chr10g0464791 [Helianthus annuus]|nr:hypothetical protein HanIR_Chr10g0464791 [Helianthus annuus]
MLCSLDTRHKDLNTQKKKKKKKKKKKDVERVINFVQAYLNMYSAIGVAHLSCWVYVK